MTTTHPRPTPAAGPLDLARASARRVTALGRAELRLLWRNRTALLYAVATPAFAFVFVSASDGFAGPGGATGAIIVTGVTAIGLGMVVYYNLVTAYVGRREEHVLKRLRTGELTDAEILAGTAVPSLAVAWLQVVAAIAIGAGAGQLRMPANALLVVLAVTLGSLVFPLLAAASSAMTRTVEMAQVTTAPLLFVPLALSGLVAPIRDLPAGFARAAEVMPLTPVVDLMRLGLLGVDRDGEHLGTAATFAAAAPSLAVGAAWVLVGLWATRRWFRWEPRR
jgi:ABC-2 type transport system permease protein